MSKCIDCKKIINVHHDNPSRCRECYLKINKGKNHPNYKNGYTLYQHYCKDCGCKISNRAERCLSCAGKYYNKTHNPIMLGKKHTKLTIKRLKCAAKRYLKQSRRRMLGKKNPSWKDGRTLKKYFCKECGSQISKWAGYKGKGTCILCSNKNISRAKKIKYKNFYLRGNWELSTAKYLTKNHIKWQYEPKTFKFNKFRYTPDFYLPEFNLYIEVKGHWYDNSKRKYLNFKKKFKNIILFNKKKLTQLGILK